MLAYAKPYGLGDAQIDKQNWVGRIMGDTVAGWDAARNNGSLTLNMLVNGLAVMQNAINEYASMYSNTDRGITGRNELQSLYNRIAADAASEMASMPESYGPTYIPSGPTGDLNASPVMQPYNPNVDYTINVVPSGNAPSTAANLQPSQTPGPPAGITVPPDAPTSPAWMRNPLVWIVGGLGLMYVIKKGGNL